MTPDRPDRIGPWQIGGVLGHGATSIVYRGADQTGREAAVKLLRGELLLGGEGQSMARRFRQEAELGRRLDHPGVVRVFGAGDLAGNPYMAMELLTGTSLAEMLRGPRLDPARAVAMVADLLDALSYVHGQRIVHRDIKPANVILRETGRVCLVDFGIARAEASEITQLGELLGSPAYMAPEQLAGGAVDARADLFSVGVLLYGLATRQRPFSGTVAAVMHAILTATPPPPTAHDPALPRALDAVMARALAKAPDDRFASAAEFAAALRGLVPQFATPSSASAPAAGQGRAAAALAPAAVPGALRAATAATASGPLDEADIVALERAEAAWDGWDAAARSALQALPDWEDDQRNLTALIVENAPVPQATRRGRQDWMLLVRLAAAGLRLMNRAGRGQAARALHRDLCDELVEPFIVYIDTAGAMLSQQDSPDLSRLSMDLLRLDVIEMALESLSAAGDLRLVRKMRLLVAMQAMRKVNDSVASYTRTGDMLARFDVALIMAEIESLIAIAARLTEDDSVPIGLRLRTMTTAVIQDFIEGAQTLASMTLEELRDPGGAADLRVFALRLGQVQALYHFASRLPGERHRALMGRFAEALYRQVEDLCHSLMDRGDSRDALSVLYDMAAELGWAQLAAAVLAHLRR